MHDKFPSTNLPQTSTPQDAQKAHLDMLAKVNQTHADALSAASAAQAAATPTNGSNTNGTYTQFPDGTMIAIGASVNQTTASGVGAVFYNNTTFTFPVAFKTAPTVSITLSGSTGLAWPGPAGAITTTGFTGAIIGAANTSNGTYNYIAIGRWK